MKIVVLNGNQDKSNSVFEGYVRQYAAELETRKNSVQVFTLRYLSIHHCVGCWSCWMKTPGACVFNDDTPKVLTEIIQADLLVCASPLNMGFVGYETKKFNERMIPLLLPYLKITENEFHHPLRYGRNPKLALLLQKEPDTDTEDITITSDIYRRLALNMSTKLKFVKFIDEPLREVSDETCRI